GVVDLAGNPGRHGNDVLGLEDGGPREHFFRSQWEHWHVRRLRVRQVVVAAPNGGGRPVALRQRPDPGHRGGGPEGIAERVGTLTIVDAAYRELARPLTGGSDGESRGQRIDCAALQSPALF